MTAPVLMLVDGHGLFHRAYHAGLRGPDEPLRTSAGEPTWAVFGFVRMLLGAIAEREPAAIAVALDVPRDTLERRRRFAGYKAGRPPMPADMPGQLDRSVAVARALGVPTYQYLGHEADDVIGSIAEMVDLDAWRVEILTQDRDLFQLVRDGVEVLMPATGLVDKGEPRLRAHDAAAVRGRMGVGPEQIVDYKALAGDESDNIRGVPGVGEKIALDLLATYGSLDGVYADGNRLYELGLTDGRRKALVTKLAVGAESARMSRDLATIRRDLPIPFALADATFRRPDVSRLVALLRELEFEGLADQFAAIGGAA